MNSIIKDENINTIFHYKFLVNLWPLSYGRKDNCPKTFFTNKLKFYFLLKCNHRIEGHTKQSIKPVVFYV